MNFWNATAIANSSACFQRRLLLATPANLTTSTDALFKALIGPAPDPQVVHAAIEEFRQLAGENIISQYINMTVDSSCGLSERLSGTAAIMRQVRCAHSRQGK